MKKIGINSEKCIEYGSSDNQMDKPQHGRPKRAELPDANINTKRKVFNSERTSLIMSPLVNNNKGVAKTVPETVPLIVDTGQCLTHLIIEIPNSK